VLRFAVLPFVMTLSACAATACGEPSEIGAAKETSESAPGIEIVPPALNLILPLDGSPAEGEVTILQKSNEPVLRIRRIAMSPELKGGRITELMRTAHGWKIGLRVQATENVDVSGMLIIVPVDKTITEIAIPVTLRALARSSIEPAKIFFGIVKPGQAVTKTVKIRTRSSDEISDLVLVEPGNANGLKASLSHDQENKNLYSIALTWTPQDGQQKLLEHVCIKGISGERVVELIDIPCLGLQSGAGESHEAGGSK